MLRLLSPKYTQLSQISDQLPTLLHTALNHLQQLQESTSKLESERYELLAGMERLERELIGNTKGTGRMMNNDASASEGAQSEVGESRVNVEEGDEPRTDERGENEEQSLLIQLQQLQERLEGLELGMRWIGVLERVMELR